MKVLLNKDFEYIAGGQTSTTPYGSIETNDSVMESVDEILGASMLFAAVNCINARNISIASVSYGAFSGALVGFAFMGMKYAACKIFVSEPLV